MQTLSGGFDTPTALAFHPHNKLLAVARFAPDTEGVQLWRIEDQTHLYTLRLADAGYEDEDYAAYKSIAFSPDGQFLASGHFEAGEVWLWKRREVPRKLQAHLAIQFTQAPCYQRG